MPSMYWLVLIVILAIIELLTTALTTIWFVGGGLLAFALSLFGVPDIVQWIVFVVVSLAALLLTRPIIRKKMEKTRVKTNVESLIGQKARVTLRIDNGRETGSAIIGGQEWTARSSDDGVVIPVDTFVEILEIRGVKLIVKPIS